MYCPAPRTASISSSRLNPRTVCSGPLETVCTQHCDPALRRVWEGSPRYPAYRIRGNQKRKQHKPIRQNEFLLVKTLKSLNYETCKRVNPVARVTGLPW